jgi:hypothetical protein
MKAAVALLGLAATILAKEIPKNLTLAAELYDSGLMHEMIMMEKEAFWAEEDARAAARQGLMAEDPWPELHFAQCR